MTFALARLGIDEPMRYEDGMSVLADAALRLVGGGPNAVFLAQSQPVRAAGENSTDAAPVVQNRAGATTYFGPGVLLVAPVALAEPVRLHEALLQAGEATCAEYGVTVTRRNHFPGLWINDDAGWRKVASIGLGGKGLVVAGGGGLSLNVCPDLSAFDGWNPCNIPGVRMTSLAAETGRALSVAEVADTIATHLQRLLPAALLTPAAAV